LHASRNSPRGLNAHVPFHSAPPRFIGSFSTKNSRKYEIAFTTPAGHRVMAYIDFNPYFGKYAVITFHPIIFTPIQGGAFRENANKQIVLQAPHRDIFHIRNCSYNFIVPPWFDSYWLHWSYNFNIVVGGVIWETFINQEQLSRSTILRPLQHHNLLNDTQQDLHMDDEDDNLGDDEDDNLGDDEDDNLDDNV
jgi:hypothetical protein